MEEKTLVEKARKGNQAAFKQLVIQHEQQIIATVRGMLGDTGEVADVSQQVFINFYKSLHQFKEKAKVSTYLTRIAINLSLNEIKRRQRKNRWFVFFKTDPPTLSIADQSQHPDRRDTKELVHKALQQLSLDLRSVVVLRLIDGYSTQETADILNIPLGTVLSRLSRGRKQLKCLLRQERL